MQFRLIDLHLSAVQTFVGMRATRPTHMASSLLQRTNITYQRKIDFRKSGCPHLNAKYTTQEKNHNLRRSGSPDPDTKHTNNRKR